MQFDYKLWKKGDFILKVKDNQKDLKDDIKTFFDFGIRREDTNIIVWDTDFEKDHGRIEKRFYYLSYDVDCISDKEKWKSVKAIGRILVELKFIVRKMVKFLKLNIIIF